MQTALARRTFLASSAATALAAASGLSAAAPAAVDDLAARCLLLIAAFPLLHAEAAARRQLAEQDAGDEFLRAKVSVGYCRHHDGSKETVWESSPTEIDRRADILASAGAMMKDKAEEWRKSKHAELSTEQARIDDLPSVRSVYAAWDAFNACDISLEMTSKALAAAQGGSARTAERRLAVAIELQRLDARSEEIDGCTASLVVPALIAAALADLRHESA